MTSAFFRADASGGDERRRLTFDLDVDICVIGAGLAGLSVALEAAQMGASVAVLEARHVGWGASGHQLGTVMPGYGASVDELIARLGFDHARELWALSLLGMDRVRAIAAEQGAAVSGGALEVSNVDHGERLIRRLQILGEDFGTDVEGWPAERVRDVLTTPRYFHAVHYPTAFQLDGNAYLHGLARLAKAAGVRLFEETPVTRIDASGIRKRIMTARARLRAEHLVLAGNVHLGATAPRVAATLLPVWRYAAVTAPLGDRLAEAIAFRGSVVDTDGIDHFRIVDGDRLAWASPETTWAARPQSFGSAIRRRIRTIFPQLGNVDLAEFGGGAVGRTVHGMPQIGALRPGLWVASGLGRHGMTTAALAGHLIARSILWGDDRWRLLAPFELVWAGGRAGQAAGHAVWLWTRGVSAAAGAAARWRERARARERAREMRAMSTPRRAGTRRGA